MGKAIHVMPSDDGWDVKEEGSGRATHFDTQIDALRAGREMARHNRSEHIVHGRDGRVRQQDSYSRDPFPPRSS